MKQNEMFGKALWIAPKDRGEDRFFVMSASFSLEKVKKAALRVIGLGYFHCYINGKRVSDEWFLPLSSDYEPREKDPVGEILAGHRIYVPEFDVTELLKDGDNKITVHFGGGWYTDRDGAYGVEKVIWRLSGESESGEFDLVSDEKCKIGASYISDYRIIRVETQDLRRFVDDKDPDDAAWEYASVAKQLDTEYYFIDCPTESIRESCQVKKILEEGERKVYDCGKNSSALPVIRIFGEEGETVTVNFSEELNADGDMDPKYCQHQILRFICDGEERVVCPMFTWFGYRYFSVTGKAEAVRSDVVHCDIKVTARFESDNEMLNWLNKAFINTQLTNMHGGIPSDCPHLERRGYTGDGQLVCHAAMNVVDGESFYRKWIRDIGDCQDTLTGHVQYTAPYMRSGGGPGGWGCAIVEVPYQFYRHYGDKTPLYEHYDGMKRYFDYLEAHSVSDLVVSDKEGEWCLGDWCPPTEVIIAAPFVNNYFYIKSLYRAVEIARFIGREEDIPEFEERIERRKKALMAAYFNTWDGNFFGCRQGANAFAVDIGIGDERTLKNLIKYYERTGCYDTGIFGTDIVTRVLFEKGEADLAVKLLTSEHPNSFNSMRLAGATTIWEYWPHANHDRSHNHPMFGAVVAYLYDHLLGIGQSKSGAGYEELIIAPVTVEGVGKLSGSRTLPQGEVSVSYEKSESGISFEIAIPEGQKAKFVFNGNEFALGVGVNKLNF